MIGRDYQRESGTAEMLCGFLQMAMGGTHSAEGAICLRGDPCAGAQTEGVAAPADGVCVQSRQLLISECPVCETFFEGNREGPLIANTSTDEARCARCASPSKSTLTVPVRYQGTTLGLMALGATGSDHYTASHLDVCKTIASEIAYHVKRYELSETMRSVYGRDLMLVGASGALRKVDEFIERASQADLPALILGEFGSEKRHVAYALHFGGRPDTPFVEVKCATLDRGTLKQNLSDQLRRADGGTIFFNGIDELEYPTQCQLSDVIESEIGNWTRPYQSERVQVRLLASSLRHLDETEQERELCSSLVEKFDFLLTQVAPLRDRKEDIKPLIEYFLSRHSGQPRRTFSREVVEAFEAYDWPRNVYELERFVARLVVMSKSEVIGMQDAFDHTPKLAERLQGFNRAPTNVKALSCVTLEERRTGPISPLDETVVQLARSLIKGEFVALSRFHPGLKSALLYLAGNHREVITLQELSRHAGLSASHLAYLFQKNLSVSFKSFLAVVRIEEAKQLLAEKPHMRITEISFQVGFGDLRHFERTFKRLVGKSPKEYRNLAAQDWVPGRAS